MIATGVSTVAGVAVGAATFGVAGPIGAQVIAGMVSEAVYYISYQLLTGQDINIEDLILTTIIGGLTSLGFAKLASSPALRQAINKHVAAPLKKLLGKGSTPAAPAAAKPPKTTTPTPTTPTQGGATAATSSGSGSSLPLSAPKGGAACSFTGDTVVLMADGTKKPIQDIQPGDQVIATNPETGQQETKTVTHTHVHDDTVTDLVVDGEIITTTEDHPFWSVTDQQYERANQLAPGEQVLTADGHTMTVSGLQLECSR